MAPLIMAAPRSIHHFVFKICETKPATDHKSRETKPWPGICFYVADAARVVWMEGPNGQLADTYYDGVEAGPLYSRESLDDDIAAADLIIATAIGSPGVIASDDSELNDALMHVRAAIHLTTEAPKDWLSWFVDRLAEVPTLPQLNARRAPKLKSRGVAKSKPKCECSRQQFATNLRGLSGPDITLLWQDHKRSSH